MPCRSGKVLTKWSRSNQPDAINICRDNVFMGHLTPNRVSPKPRTRDCCVGSRLGQPGSTVHPEGIIRWFMRGLDLVAAVRSRVVVVALLFARDLPTIRVT